jgi:hypothetical protein
MYSQGLRKQSFRRIAQQHALSKHNKLAAEMNEKIKLKQSDRYVPVHPRGLYHTQHDERAFTMIQLVDGWNFFKDVEWFQRFGKQYPTTAHYNGFHCMALDHWQIKSLVETALKYSRDNLVDHPTLSLMQSDLSKVSIAVMKHKGATRIPNARGGSKLRLPSWGLGAHPDTWAADGEGIVIMIVLADTKDFDRRFRFSMPSKGYAWEVCTPDGCILVFTGDAYDCWEHESIRSDWQDGTCISLTIRMANIDSYNGWSIPDELVSTLKREGVKVPTSGGGATDTSSVGFARIMQKRRIEARDRVQWVWDSRALAHIEPDPEDADNIVVVPNVRGGLPNNTANAAVEELASEDDFEPESPEGDTLFV